MLTPILWFLTQTLVSVAALPCAWAPVIPTVELSRLHSHPADVLGVQVRFFVQLDQEVAEWNPYSTRFGSESYRCFRVWGDDQRLWDVEAYHHPVARLFVRDGGRQVARMARGARFQRFVVHGTVRQVLLGEPWIEVDRIVPTRYTVPEGTLLHATRGIELLDRGALKMAHDEFQRALVKTLPAHLRKDLEALLASCEESAGLAAAATAR